MKVRADTAVHCAGLVHCVEQQSKGLSTKPTALSPCASQTACHCILPRWDGSGKRRSHETAQVYKCNGLFQTKPLSGK